MSQSFRLKSDELRQNNPARDVRQQDDPSYKIYPDNGQIRNFMLTWPDGSSTTIPYYTVGRIEYSSADGSITVVIGNENIVFAGVDLKSLYNDFFFQLPLEIIVTDERYNEVNKSSHFIVNKINKL
ncbi:hypothetical protein OQX63_17260 [Pedobacter sp. PF22-3]|uniref:hypothetical protein n=1 Tax=Pedobacter sp. PF22-3 TaxID=2994467 RepID=UPI002247B071|nr:hypothetical protein [Pedobacter sp. PF22-3]MCX2495242.1 hypothetical protein [Pedobacter sp. PF22-3]